MLIKRLIEKSATLEAGKINELDFRAGICRCRVMNSEAVWKISSVFLIRRFCSLYFTNTRRTGLLGRVAF